MAIKKVIVEAFKTSLKKTEDSKTVSIFVQSKEYDLSFRDLLIGSALLIY